MYGSIRTLCASSTELTDFGLHGILWGDRMYSPRLWEQVLKFAVVGMGETFRHAGFSNDEPQSIIPGELYCGRH